MDRLPVYILAGGRSRRFGSDKARALLDGKPLILHAADSLRPFASSITVVADAPDKYADLRLATIPDLRPGLGPVGGLQAALHHCEDPWLLLSSCDFPNVQPSWIESLLRHRSDHAQAVAFNGGDWQPFPGLYSCRLRVSPDDHGADTSRSMRTLLKFCHATSVPLPPDWPQTPGINTPAELTLHVAPDNRGRER